MVLLAGTSRSYWSSPRGQARRDESLSDLGDRAQTGIKIRFTEDLPELREYWFPSAVAGSDQVQLPLVVKRIGKTLDFRVRGFDQILGNIAGEMAAGC
jgi:hypothetical protein